MSAVSGMDSIAQTTIGCEVACGYLVRPEKLVGYAKANSIRHSETSHIVLRAKMAAFIKKKHPVVRFPIITKYPRLQSPYLSPRYLMFVTRSHLKRYNYQYSETDEDRCIRDDYMKLDSDMRDLLTDAKFVTIPDPADEIILPGEEGILRIKWVP